nr:MAG TPA: hypothetical protein [Caudoviricetes sp.]
MGWLKLNHSRLAYLYLTPCQSQLYKNPNRSGLPKSDLNITVFIYSNFSGHTYATRL